MKFFGLKDKIAHKFIKNQLKIEVKSEKYSPMLVEKVGILAEAELFKAYDFTKKLSENFNLPIENFQLIVSQESVNEVDETTYNIFSDKDFKLNANIKTENIQQFADTKFDLLINYCNHDNLYANVLVLHSKALIKAGFDNEETPFYDISVKTQANKIHTFNEELTKYLQIMNFIK